MKEELRLFIELQEKDSVIIRETALIEAIPKKLSASEEPLKNAQAAYEKHKLKYETLLKKKRDKDRLLDEINEKIKKSKAHSAEIKTNKEYQAHLKEVELSEKERYAVEDEILSLMETLDASQRELEIEETKVSAEKDKIEVLKEKLKEDIAEKKEKVGELKSQRDELVKVIDGDLYNLYLKILKTKKGRAVAEAKDEICQGCNMNIPPQLFVEIKKNDNIIQCPQCTRILYWKG